MSSRSEWAWAAGFFDGEGTTYLHGRRHLVVVVPQKGTELLIRLKTLAGGLVSKDGSSRGLSRWSTSGRNALTFLRGIWPFVGSAKRSQAEITLARLCSPACPIAKPAASWDAHPAARTICSRGHSMLAAIRSSRGNRECRTCSASRKACHRDGRTLAPALVWYRNAAWWDPSSAADPDDPYWLPVDEYRQLQRAT